MKGRLAFLKVNPQGKYRKAQVERGGHAQASVAAKEKRAARGGSESW
jgi:hypothetical protein